MEGDADIVILREWLMKQTHLPQKIGLTEKNAFETIFEQGNGENSLYHFILWLHRNQHHNLIGDLAQLTIVKDKLLKRYLQASNNSIELAKNLIDLSFTLRSQAPEIFAERDPTQPSLQSTFEIIDYLLLPQRLNNINIFLYRITSNDVDKYDFVNGCKAFFIFSDTRMIEEEDISDGEIPLFDMKNFSVKHLTKIVLPVLRKYMVYTQEAHPMNLKQIHLLNVPPFLDRMMMLLKPLMNSEVSKMLHFHSPNSETLFEYIPRDFLPEEYGGTKGKCTDIKKYWSEKIIKRRDYLIDDARWIVDESKRPAENKGKQMYSVQGSFKTLSID